MPTKRYKPTMHVSIDSEVLEWLDQKTKREHLKRAQVVNRLLWEAKKNDEAAKAGAGAARTPTRGARPATALRAGQDRGAGLLAGTEA